MSVQEFAVIPAKPPASEQLAIVPMTLIQMAVQQGADVDKLERLLNLQLQWEKNEARKAFVSAMNDFKAAPPEINKNKHVAFTSSKGDVDYWHATLDHVVDQIGKALSRNGISHRWRTEQANGSIRVTCILTHEAGHSEETSLESGADTSGAKNSIQGIGSTVTYLQRYTLLAATGLAAKGQDSDGRAPSEGMDDNAVTDYCIQMQDAMDYPELRDVFRDCYSKAKAINDKSASDRLVKVYEQRKRELNNGQH